MPSKRTILLAERLVNAILEIPLLEMASERAGIRLKISSLGGTLCTHLLYLLNKSQLNAVHRWKVEVANYCELIYDQNGYLAKPFDAEELKEYLLTDRSINIASHRYQKKFGAIPDTQELEPLVEALCQALAGLNALDDVDAILARL